MKNKRFDQLAYMFEQVPREEENLRIILLSFMNIVAKTTPDGNEFDYDNMVKQLTILANHFDFIQESLGVYCSQEEYNDVMRESDDIYYTHTGEGAKKYETFRKRCKNICVRLWDHHGKKNGDE